MLGYWGMPAETSQVLQADGWLHTGDLVEPNADGTYTFLGRLKEVIRRRGENVAPGEIEEALMTHPDVLEAAVIGVPSDLSEEEIKAFVWVADPAAADLAAIRASAAAQLTPFKVPRYLEAVTDLPVLPPVGWRSTGSTVIAPPRRLISHERRPLAAHRYWCLDARHHHHPRPQPGRRPDGADDLHRGRVSAGTGRGHPPPVRPECWTRCWCRWPTMD